MPIPIGLVNQNTLQTEPQAEGLLDISFLANHIPKEASDFSVTVADKDANVLMEIWLNAEKSSNETYKVANIDVANKELIRLKSRGLLSGNTNEVKFTEKGRKVISTMSLGENNLFLKNRKDKSYTEILASMNKRGKKGYRIACVFDEHSHLVSF
jgi:hypothetical protein